jgi:hypothetical protein
MMPGGYGGWDGDEGGDGGGEGGNGRSGSDSSGGARRGGPKYFYLFEDETGILEGVGENRCVTYGTPPVCLLRGEVRKDSEGIPKIFNCTFLRTF